MKKCPYCAEEIQDDAIKCRFCGSDLLEIKMNNIEDLKEETLSKKELIKRKNKKDAKILFIIICIFFFIYFLSTQGTKPNTTSFDSTSPYTDGTCSTNEKNIAIKFLGIIDGEITDCTSSPEGLIGTIVGHNAFNAKIAKPFSCDKNNCILLE